ncbi:MAG: leucyl/phenylalanyl-tRNA--protein transferase [Deltaproteobacteria bacterium]|nr:leucyl/phenylalanyl-tRNA--protein transferase [Deltaproteobacteria bacterium]
MLVYQLPDHDIIFPPVELALKTGILAVGGDLSPQRLLAAYEKGIFPWYAEDEPIIWWSPDPRFVLFPAELHIAKTMKPLLKRGQFTITFDRAFPQVIASCQKPRRRESDTWITEDMRRAYCNLHDMGYAHSVEAWHENQLVGGLYGVSLGRCFFGESMFATLSNASKAAFITLVQRLKKLDFQLIDCQVYTAHLKSLGARHIPRDDFISLLKKALLYDTLRGNWDVMPAFRNFTRSAY